MIISSNGSFSMEFSDHLVKQCFQYIFDYYGCQRAELKFNNSGSRLAVQAPLADSTWLIVAILGMIKAEYDLLFLDHEGQIVNFSMAQQASFVISSVDEITMESLLSACSL